MLLFKPKSISNHSGLQLRLVTVHGCSVTSQTSIVNWLHYHIAHLALQVVSVTFTVPHHIQCLLCACYYTHHIQCHTTYSATPHTVPHYIQCHTTYSATPHTVPHHIQCLLCACYYTHHIQYHTTYSATPHTVPHHIQCLLCACYYTAFLAPRLHHLPQCLSL